ncbi:MAG: hypothetical protein Q8N62_00180 [Candidatus Omnitrophota bacterium]|nr:hypothetical protein [Candidatus Omnitrophota bacterium]
MATYKEIICLANSTRTGGKCVAGITVDNREWFRPVSEEGQLSDEQIKYANGKLPELLDIIRIPYKKLQPTAYQPENVLISEEGWQYIGKWPKNKLDSLCDKPKEIFINQVIKDRITVEFFEKNRLKSSLLLIKPESIKLFRKDFRNKKKLRAIFVYNDLEYDFGVTDPIFCEKYAKEKEGFYKLDSKDVYLCISLAAPFYKDRCCYKLVASIIEG